jgi:hypothetical protein
MELALGLTNIIPLIVYVVGLIVILLTLFYRIEVGIFFLVPLLPLQNLLDSIIKYPGGKDFIDFLYLALIIKWMLNGSKSPIGVRTKSSLNLIVGVIILWTFLELWRGTSYLGFDNFSPFDDRFEAWKNYVMLPLLCLIIVNNIENDKQIKILVILMMFSMLFMDRNFYHNFQGHDRSHYRDDIRSAGTFSYLGPNELAVFYAQNSIILVCLFLIDSDKRRKILLAVTIVFNYFCAIFLYSRGGYLAILAGLIFFGLVKDRKVMFALILFLVFWRTFTPVSVQERIDMTESEDGLDRSIEYRYEMWDQALTIFGEHPILGVGYHTIPYLGIRAGHRRASLHNGYLEVAVEQGMVGVIIFMSFFVICLLYGWRLFKVADDKFLKGLGLGYSACVVSVLAGNIFGSYWFYMNVSGFYWTFLALVVRGIEIAEEKKSSDKPVKDEQPMDAFDHFIKENRNGDYTNMSW